MKTCNIETPSDVSRLRVVHTLEGEVLADEDVVTIKKVGVFSRLINNHPAVVTFGALTVLIVISCVVVFLVFLKRRQMNKYQKY